MSGFFAIFILNNNKLSSNIPQISEHINLQKSQNSFLWSNEKNDC